MSCGRAWPRPPRIFWENDSGSRSRGQQTPLKHSSGKTHSMFLSLKGLWHNMQTSFEILVDPRRNETQSRPLVNGSLRTDVDAKREQAHWVRAFVLSTDGNYPKWRINCGSLACKLRVYLHPTHNNTNTRLPLQIRWFKELLHEGKLGKRSMVNSKLLVPPCKFSIKNKHSFPLKNVCHGIAASATKVRLTIQQQTHHVNWFHHLYQMY